MVAPSKELIVSVVNTIQKICTREYGMHLIKKTEVKEADKKNKCGYSGWNFVVVMKGCSVPGEIQVNTRDMMYAKMSKDDYVRDILDGNAAEYTDVEQKMCFEGGLHHLLYEIYQAKGAAQDEKDLAATLSKDYCNLARLPASQRQAKAQELGMAQRINVFHTKLHTAAAKEIWVNRLVKRYGLKASH